MTININTELYKELTELSKLIKSQKQQEDNQSVALTDYEREEIRKSAVGKFKGIVNNIMREQRFINSIKHFLDSKAKETKEVNEFDDLHVDELLTILKEEKSK